ncbi:MAG: GtrA family protein, partial [Candidatus Pacebacteria bacterium]|nr:GtrA family protein [Candidatus Paceibacterota bacterium]
MKSFSLFWGYVFFAGVATLVDFGLLYFFTEVAGLHYLFSAALAYLAGIAPNYSLNKFFNFKNKSSQIT